MLDWPEIVLRLGAATLAGGLIGLDRDLHGKPIGLKTLGLVGLATAMVVMLALPGGEMTAISDATSRVIQGILTGIGFLGAGVIVRGEHRFRVHGLTSAATKPSMASLQLAISGSAPLKRKLSAIDTSEPRICAVQRQLFEVANCSARTVSANAAFCNRDRRFESSRRHEGRSI